MSRSFRFLLWYCFLPAFLIVLVYPPKIHGYLNPYDEGLWLGLAQALIEGKIIYRDVFFHYGPIIPWGLRWTLHHFTPTLSLIRMVFWMMNVLALLLLNWCLLRMVRSTFLRIVLSFSLWCVPLAAPVLTIPMAARYGIPFASILCWSFETANSKNAWAVYSGIFAALAFWISQEVGTAILIAGFLYAFLSRHRSAKWHFILGCAAVFFIVALALGVSGLKAYWACAVSETATIFFRDAIPFPRWAGTLRSLGALCALFLPTISYAAVLIWTLYRTAVHRSWDRFALALAVYGSLTAVTAWTQPDLWHIYFALSPALLLWGYAAQHASQTSTETLVALALTAMISLVSTWPYAFIAWQKERMFLEHARQSTLERAGISRLPSSQANGYEALVQEIQRQIPQDQAFVFYPYDGSIYFLANRPNPTFFPVLALAVNEPLQERIVKDMDASSVQWVVQDTEDNAFKGVPIETFLAPVDRYIRTHFALQASLGPFRFLKRCLASRGGGTMDSL